MNIQVNRQTALKGKSSLFLEMDKVCCFFTSVSLINSQHLWGESVSVSQEQGLFHMLVQDLKKCCKIFFKIS